MTNNFFTPPFKQSLKRLSVMLFALSSLFVETSFAQQRPPAPVKIAEVVEREVASGQLFVATVFPLKQVIIGSAVDGRVTELLAEEGQRITAKEPLAQLLTNTINLELEASVAELELRREELSEMENGTRPEELEQAKAKMLGAKANWEYARADFDRLQKLRESKAVSQGDFDRAFALATASQQAYFELKSAYELAEIGPRKEKIAQAHARVAMQSAIVQRIEDRIKKYTIISRFDGYVVSEFTESGAWLKSGDPVFEVVALDEVEVRGFVVEQHIAHIHPGMDVRVEVPALPGRIFTGVVTKIIPRADMRARTFPINVKVKNEITDAGPLLKSGMYARIELPTGAARQAVLVPKDALVLGGPKPAVFVVTKNAGPDSKTGTVAPIPVELGIASNGLIQVKGDLKAGQWVVVEGNERLRPGQEVSIASVLAPEAEQTPSEKTNK